MKKLITPLFALAIIMAGCNSNKKVSGRYDDGIYYNPKKSEEPFGLHNLEEDDEPVVVNNYEEDPDQLDYYDPDDVNSEYYGTASASGGTTVVNNYYNSPGYRPVVNSGFYWNSWGGWGMNFGWGYGGFYDPFFYSPYWGWNSWCGPGGYYRPYYGGYYGGYNSYWAGYNHGYWNGYYDGNYGGGYYGRNVVYARSNSLYYRTNSYNARGRAYASKNSIAQGNGRTYSRSSAGTATAGRTAAYCRSEQSKHGYIIKKNGFQV